jgi:hypothetical protein
MVNADKTEDRFIRIEAKLDKMTSKVDGYKKILWGLVIIALVGECSFIWAIIQVISK